MIIANILGGLGNQMFQYACGYTLAEKNKTQLKLDVTGFQEYSLRSFELDKFDLQTEKATIDEIRQMKYKPISFVEKLARKLVKKSRPLSKNYYKEPHLHFDPTLFERGGDLYIEGYWQSEKYFAEYRDILLKKFTLKKNMHNETQNYRKQIASSDSVSLHIRRGDYVENSETNSFHGTCSVDYYRGAVEKIGEKIPNSHFFIFSDDLGWAIENLFFIENKTFVELPESVPDHEEMYLMSRCEHNIVANSSFSWWGAWLNSNSDKIVIAPKRWFNDVTINTEDLIPKEWIQL